MAWPWALMNRSGFKKNCCRPWHSQSALKRQFVPHACMLLTRCMLHAPCCWRVVHCVWHAARRTPHALYVACMLHAARRTPHAARRMRVECCLLRVACMLHSACTLVAIGPKALKLFRRCAGIGEEAEGFYTAHSHARSHLVIGARARQCVGAPTHCGM